MRRGRAPLRFDRGRAVCRLPCRELNRKLAGLRLSNRTHGHSARSNAALVRTCGQAAQSTRAKTMNRDERTGRQIVRLSVTRARWTSVTTSIDPVAPTTPRRFGAEIRLQVTIRADAPAGPAGASLCSRLELDAYDR